jgi:hypothetical protein
MAKDMTPLDPTVILATLQDDGIDLVAITAMREGRHTVAQLEATLPDKKDPVACHPVVVTDEADRRRFALEVYPRARKRAERLTKRIEARISAIEAGLRAAR